MISVVRCESNKTKNAFFLKITYRQKASTSRSATIHVLFLTSNNLSLNSLQIWFKAALASRVELVPDLALHCRHFHLLSHSKVPFSWKRSTQGSKSADMIPEQTGGDEFGKNDRESVFIMKLMTIVLLKDDNTWCSDRKLLKLWQKDTHILTQNPLFRIITDIWEFSYNKERIICQEVALQLNVKLLTEFMSNNSGADMMITITLNSLLP